jgi:hypothetical protein
VHKPCRGVATNCVSSLSGLACYENRILADLSFQDASQQARLDFKQPAIADPILEQRVGDQRIHAEVIGSEETLSSRRRQRHRANEILRRSVHPRLNGSTSQRTSFGVILVSVPRCPRALLARSERRDFLEICEDRYQTRSTILTSLAKLANCLWPSGTSRSGIRRSPTAFWTDWCAMLTASRRRPHCSRRLLPSWERMICVMRARMV